MQLKRLSAEAWQNEKHYSKENNNSKNPTPRREILKLVDHVKHEGQVRSGQVMSCHVMSCHVMSCHVMSCHVMSCHVMSCHVMSCHVMSGQVRSGQVRSGHNICFFCSFLVELSSCCVTCKNYNKSSGFS